jgi:trehalose/maltose transport system substrate-binding protein
MGRLHEEEETMTLSMLGRRRRAILAAGMALAALVAAGCGDDDSDTDKGAATKRPAGLTLASTKGAKGTVTYCTGKDTSGDKKAGVARFSKQFGAQGLKARLFEFPEAADEQRNQFVQRQQAKSPECDIFDSDDQWTAEFVAQRWLADVSAYVAERKSEFIPASLKAGQYEGKHWGVPFQADTGLIYYRTDQVTDPPETWQQLYDQAAKENGFVYQGAPYEGLTVDFLDVAISAGGQVLTDDGKKSAINSPENLKALQLMVEGIKNGAAPKGVTTYMEEPSRRAFENGRATYMRNWPYAYALGNQKGSKIKGKFNVAPLPAFEGAQRKGVLGVHNLVISAYSKNKPGALKLIDYLTTPEAQRIQAGEYGRTPTLTAVFDDPDVKRAMPFAQEMKQAITQGAVRPQTPVYPQVSQAVYKNVNAALSGQISPEEALKKADEEINRALETF